jgi:hypothetical protein
LQLKFNINVIVLFICGSPNTSSFVYLRFVTGNAQLSEFTDVLMGLSYSIMIPGMIKAMIDFKNS